MASKTRLIARLIVLFCIATSSVCEECGKQRSATQLVFGGKGASPAQWPWLVPLMYKASDEFFCTANLISHQHLLTAAHCVHQKQAESGLSPENIYAYLGRFDLTKTIFEPNSQKEDIKRITIHPDWKPKDVRFDADIAILTLKNRIEFTAYIQPVCLPAPNTNVFDKVGQVAGWGKSEAGDLYEVKPRQVQISSYSNEECFFADYRFAQFGSPRTFCAGERGKTPCQGDSGAGFLSNDIDPTTWRINGLVSSAIVQACGESDYVLFTNVAKYLTWIETEVNKTNSNNDFDAIFSEFDEGEVGSSVPVIDAQCKYQNSGSSYGCIVKGLRAPDSDIDLNVIGGAHQGRRTNRDVSFMQVTQGKVTHFPDLSRVVAEFPNMNGFGIHFTQMKNIDREKLKSLGKLKFFLINDNEIEEIPADTFLDLKNLELIDICRNKIKRLDPNWLATMPKLRVFKARTNKFQLIPANMFKNNPQLEEILFDYNEIARSEVDFKTLRNLKLVAMLQNKCIDLEYCKDSSKKCIQSLEQFSYIVTGHCGVFNY